jgi:hypothetical protein
MTIMTKRDTHSIFSTVEWTDADTAAYRAETERLFRSRTPARSILDVRWEDRVPRSELRGWCIEHLGKMPPEEDPDWQRAQVFWYKKMGHAVIKELDPEYFKNIKGNGAR